MGAQSCGVSLLQVMEAWKQVRGFGVRRVCPMGPPCIFQNLHVCTHTHTHKLFNLILLNFLPLFYNEHNAVVHTYICGVHVQDFLIIEMRSQNSLDNLEILIKKMTRSAAFREHRLVRERENCPHGDGQEWEGSGRGGWALQWPEPGRGAGPGVGGQELKGHVEGRSITDCLGRRGRAVPREGDI